MRVWVLTNEYEPNIIGGLGVVATHLSEAMAAQGAEVTVFAKHGGQDVLDAVKNGIRLIRFPRRSQYHSVREQQFRSDAVHRWLRLHNRQFPQVLHVHSLQFARLARMLQQRYGLPLIYTCHSLVLLEGKRTPFRRRIAKRQERLMRVADRIIVPSEWQRQAIRKYYPTVAAKTDVIENGVHVREEETQPPRHHLLFVGRLVEIKGIRELMQAVARLARKYPDVRLDIVGSGSKYFTGKLDALEQEFGLTPYIRRLGYKRPQEVVDLYPRYSAVVVPSKQESFGLVALEALAAGVPLVATRSGGLAGFVNETTAEVIEEVTPSAIAQAIEAVWEGGEEQVRARVIAGQEIARRYEWEQVAKRYLARFAKHF
ncbi:MAG TPA: glycosyltransferase family 4 protein [Bacilli bacterium]|nr:glycosyltransferase family 4 protein [Bacilli bacterium]